MELLISGLIDLMHPEDAEHSRAAREERSCTDAAADLAQQRGVRLPREVRPSTTGRPRAPTPSCSTQMDGPMGRSSALRLVGRSRRGAAGAMDDEELLRVNMDAVQDPLVLLQAVREPDTGRIVDFRYLDVNEAHVPVPLRPREDLFGRDPGMAPGHHQSGLFALYVAAVASSSRPLWTTSDTTTRSSPARYYDIRAHRVSGDRLSVTWRDVTDRHEAAERIAESEERYRLLARTPPTWSSVAPDSVVLWVSPALTAVLGWEPYDWVGRPLASSAPRRHA